MTTASPSARERAMIGQNHIHLDPARVNSDEQVAADAIRVLAMDAVEAAGSGHPGMPMGMADIATVVWGHFLRVDPTHPTWPDRDRFILSNGHGSMLLYALLHLSGFNLPLEQLRRFRQWGSASPGHPEYRHTPGVEMTTGPLGQGFATAVGMAIAEAQLRAQFGDELVDHRVFAFVSDGDLMEGISSEAASLAGLLGLGRIVCLYDANSITIDGSTDLSFREDVAGRFRALGWHASEVDGHDRSAIAASVQGAIDEDARPSIVICRTQIGYGAPRLQGSAAAHGAPLGPDEVAATKERMGWPADAPFHIPDGAYRFFEGVARRGRQARIEWEHRKLWTLSTDSDLADLWRRRFEHHPVTIDQVEYPAGARVATRAVGGKVMAQLESKVPGLIGGSADLASSTKTVLPGSGDFTGHNPLGRNLHFGVREHAMGAICNGLTLHGGARGYGSTFLVFSDYQRPAIRLSAIMGIPTIWVFTHDSIFVGEDGPTHQPIEHLASLRAMPNLWVIRPADAIETAQAWEVAINRTEGPTVLVLTRQELPVAATQASAGAVGRGAYVVRPGQEAVLVATGSEVHLALEAAAWLSRRGIEITVASMPCREAFQRQPQSYREAVIDPTRPVATLEAGATFGWAEVAGSGGLTIGIDHFGASAPGQVLAEKYGFTPEAVGTMVEDWLRRMGRAPDGGGRTRPGRGP